MEIGNVAFKAFLYMDKNSENHEEVRWFHVDQNAVVSLDLVKQKLVSTFPRLVDREFKLYWKDCDNDLVLISTDTELLIALTNITTEPRRLYIHLEPTQNNSPNNVHHVGVVCDGCGGEIYGFRYKCVECPDFDLCFRCESNGVHSEHCFLRLTDFTATRRLRKCLSASRKIFRHCDREAGKHGKRHGGHPRHGWYELLSQFVTDINSPEEETNKDNEKAESNAQKEAPKSSKCPFMAPKSSGDSGNKESDCHVSYLRNIGQTIASLLDPLGIDVDVEVRSKNKSNDKMETENQTKDNEPKPSSSKTDTTPKPEETNNTNRAVPVFPPDYVPIYMDTKVHTPIVSAFVNGQPINGQPTAEGAPAKGEPQVKVGMSAFVNGVPVFSSSTPNVSPNSEPQATTAPSMSSSNATSAPSAPENTKDKKNEPESGWTLIDDASSTSSEDNSTASEKQTTGGEGDSSNKDETTKPAQAENNQQPGGPQPGFAGNYPNMGPIYGFPPMASQFMPGMNSNMNQGQNMPGSGFPAFMPQFYPGMHNYAQMGQNYPGQAQAPNPGFNFDNMARELQRHLQTQFAGAMNAASNVASNMSNSRPSSASNGANGSPSNDPNATEGAPKKV